MRSNSILDMFGTSACHLYYVSSVSHNVFLIVDGLAMAVFRLFCVRYQVYLRVSLETLMTQLIWVQSGLVAMLVMYYWYAVELYGSSNLLQFCNGYTTKVISVS